MSPRPRKQLLLELGVFLLLGAIVNVAVAWTLPNYTRLTWSDDGPPNVDDIEWWQANAPVGRDVHDAPARVFHLKAFGWHIVSMIELKRTERTQPTGHKFERKMIGWPMLSLQSSLWDDPTQRDTSRGAFFLSNLLPIGPLWPGFAINTIFYAALLWVLWIAPGKIRRLMRFRRGCCPTCGYRIADGVGPRCSECGHALK